MADARSSGRVVESAPPRSTVVENGGSTMRYRCLIIDEEERLDASLRDLFARFAATAPPDPGRAAGEPAGEDATPARRGIKLGPWRAAPWPAPRMW